MSQGWDSHRLQLLQDSIALHSTFTGANYKEQEVQLARKEAGKPQTVGEAPVLLFGTTLLGLRLDSIVK